MITFLRRLGPDPHNGAKRTAACDGCPDIWELDNGDIAVIGIRITRDAVPNLPASANCGPDEEIILLPRPTMLAAQQDISTLV
jgi:hypothetical protein